MGTVGTPELPRPEGPRSYSFINVVLTPACTVTEFKCSTEAKFQATFPASHRRQLRPKSISGSTPMQAHSGCPQSLGRARYRTWVLLSQSRITRILELHGVPFVPCRSNVSGSHSYPSLSKKNWHGVANKDEPRFILISSRIPAYEVWLGCEPAHS